MSKHWNKWDWELDWNHLPESGTRFEWILDSVFWNSTGDQILWIGLDCFLCLLCQDPSSFLLFVPGSMQAAGSFHFFLLVDTALISSGCPHSDFGYKCSATDTDTFRKCQCYHVFGWSHPSRLLSYNNWPASIITCRTQQEILRHHSCSLTHQLWRVIQ